MLLSISDWVYADNYRYIANKTIIPEGLTVWTVGHWGWQWYSEQNGFRQYNYDISELENGDYFVYPGDISRPSIEEDLNLRPVDSLIIKPKLVSLLSVSNYASLYSSDHLKPTWTLSRGNIDTIFISKFEEEVVLK